MNQNSFSENWVNLYDKFFRRDAHQLLAWGYQDAKHKFNSKLEETEITGFIAEKIEARFDHPDTPAKFDRYSLSEDKPVSSEGRTGKSRRRLDLVIECSSSKPRPSYIFEAKRLCKASASIGDYTGEEGLQRFVYEKYGAQYPEAAMIGYIQSDNYEYWIKEMNRKFDRDQKNDLRIIQKLKQIQIINSLPYEWFSEHERSTGKKIAIYHILLDCFNFINTENQAGKT